MTTQTPTMTRLYKKPIPAGPGVGPVKFELLANMFKRMDLQPIRKLEHGLEFEFKAPGWQEILLFNFHLARQWPNEVVEWMDHEEPENLDEFHRCEHSGDLFTWAAREKSEAATEETKLPKDIVNYVLEFIGDDDYAILKFDVLAKDKYGKWFVVDPGAGVKP